MYMAKNAKVLAEDIDGFMKRNTQNTLTMTWAKLYEISERQRIKEGFQNDLRSALRDNSLEITYGTNAIVIHRDANFNPQNGLEDL